LPKVPKMVQFVKLYALDMRPAANTGALLRPKMMLAALVVLILPTSSKNTAIVACSVSPATASAHLWMKIAGGTLESAPAGMVLRGGGEEVVGKGKGSAVAAGCGISERIQAIEDEMRKTQKNKVRSRECMRVHIATASL